MKKYLLWFAQDHVSIQLHPFRSSEIQSILKTLKLTMNIIDKPNDERPFWIVEMLNDTDLKKLASR